MKLAMEFPTEIPSRSYLWHRPAENGIKIIYPPKSNDENGQMRNHAISHTTNLCWHVGTHVYVDLLGNF